MPRENPAAMLRQRISSPGMLIVPGAYDALSARMVEQSGFEAVLLAGGTYTMPGTGPCYRAAQGYYFYYWK